MNSVDDQLRFDLFLNFHGSEWLPCGITTRDLMRQVTSELHTRCLKRHGIRPAIFFDEHAVHGQLTEDIFAAILQLRGGGLGLCILTPRFFDFPWCLAELAALLGVYERRCYGVRLRFLCLGCEAKDVIYHEHVRMYVDALRGHSLRTCAIVEPVDRTVMRIADVVMDVWDGCGNTALADRFPSVLGRTRDESMAYLHARFFDGPKRGGQQQHENDHNNITNNNNKKNNNNNNNNNNRNINDNDRRDGNTDRMESRESGRKTVVTLQQKEEAVASYHLKWITAKNFPWGFDQIGSLVHMFHKIRMELFEYYRSLENNYEDEDEGEDDHHAQREDQPQQQRVGFRPPDEHHAQLEHQQQQQQRVGFRPPADHAQLEHHRVGFRADDDDDGDDGDTRRKSAGSDNMAFDPASAPAPATSAIDVDHQQEPNHQGQVFP